jgi:4-amino-4-deoxy-L-arabinose transferase-like glycosyltransferase
MSKLRKLFDNRDLWVLLLLFTAVFCLNLLIPRDLWVQDEARYGEVVREMLATHGWLVPHLNGFPYPDKPPLYFWLVALVGAVVGQGEMAFRLVTVLSTALAGAGVYLAANRMFDRRAAFWSTTLFFTAFLTLVVGHIARMDMLLTATAVFAWHSLLRFRVRGRRGDMVGFWVWSALALAVKGPIALLFTLLPGLAWMVWEARWKGLRATRPLLGLGAMAALVLLWMGGVALLGYQDYLDTIWNKQLVGRAVDSWSHKEPFYFYAALAPILLMPWTGLVARGGYRLYRERSGQGRAIALFALLPLIGISLVSGKLFIYMEPLVPALCIAGGVAAAELAERAHLSRWTTWPPVLFLLLVGIGVLWIARTHLGPTAWQGYLFGSGIIALAVAAAALARLSATRWLYGSLAVCAALSWLFFGGMTYVLNPFFSARAMGQFIDSNTRAETPIGVVHSTRGIFNYYAGRTFTELEVEGAGPWLKEHAGGMLIVKSDDLQKVFGEKGVPESCGINAVYSVELKEYHVVGNCKP